MHQRSRTYLPRMFFWREYLHFSHACFFIHSLISFQPCSPNFLFTLSPQQRDRRCHYWKPGVCVWLCRLTTCRGVPGLGDCSCSCKISPNVLFWFSCCFSPKLRLREINSKSASWDGLSCSGREELTSSKMSTDLCKQYVSLPWSHLISCSMERICSPEYLLSEKEKRHNLTWLTFQANNSIA